MTKRAEARVDWDRIPIRQLARTLQVVAVRMGQENPVERSGVAADLVQELGELGGR